MLNQEIQFFINVCSLSDLGALYRFYAPNCVYLTCEKSSIRSSTVFILSSNIMNIRTFNQEINKAWEGLRQSVNCIYKIYRGTKRCIITPPFSNNVWSEDSNPDGCPQPAQSPEWCFILIILRSAQIRRIWADWMAVMCQPGEKAFKPVTTVQDDVSTFVFTSCKAQDKCTCHFFKQGLKKCK